MTRKMSEVLVSYMAACLVLGAGIFVGARAQNIQRQDPRPYALIAIQLPDTLNQIVRDSATVRMGRIRLNQAGYRPNDEKYFYYVGGSGGSFSVIDVNTGQSAATGTLTSKNTSVGSQIKIRASNNAAIVAGGDTRYIMESPAVSGTLYEGRINITTPGRYKIRVGSEESGAFVIDENLYGWVRDAAIKFPGVNRCGNTDSWFHGACHLQDATPGGWHDCGDHLKEGITQSYLHFMLALASAALRDHDVDNYGRNHNNTVHTDGIPDVLYEAKHGSDYILAAFDNAGKAVNSRLFTSIGDFGHDHMWWGQPEFHDGMPVGRGGPPRAQRNELGANILGLFSAGLSLTARNYAVFDSAHAARSIEAAKALYEYARVNQENTETPAYNGNGESQDKLAAAALGLLYATKDRRYLNDLCYDKSIFNQGGTEAFPLFGFEGGWFAKQPQFSKGFANTDWGSSHMAVLWGFYRLILKDQQMCDDIGIRPGQRDTLLTRVVSQILFNIEGISNPTSTQIAEISLPTAGQWGSSNPVTLKYDETWKFMHTQQNWMWNRYQFGNIFDLFAYSDLAMWLEDEDVQLIGRGTTNWRGREVRQLMIRQMDYMLGNNPWDISMIYGIGYKNSNHPHHRAANPEGKNVPGAFYGYRPPVGALHSGPPPQGAGTGWAAQAAGPGCQSGSGAGGTAVYCEHYDDYFNTETGIDASATMIVPIMGLSKEDPITDPPAATVRTVYVGVDMAIIEVRQTRFGMTAIRYAQDGVSTTTSVSADSNGVFHRIVLTGLTAGTRYNFDALVSDMFGNSAVINDRGELFTFVTLTSPPGNAEITNVKVCKVTSDSAEIFWYTPNGAYDSRVVYGDRRPPTTVQDGNIYGRPSQFHYVKIGGLREKTTYYFYVENNGTRDDNGGQYYQFTTPVEHVAFDIRAITYITEGRPYIGLNVINQDVKSYDSLELRVYVRGPDSVVNANGLTVSFENYVGFRLDIGFEYKSDGFIDEGFQTRVAPILRNTRMIRMEDTYNPADGTWAYYIPVVLGNSEMQSGARFRLDFSFRPRSPWPPHNDEAAVGIELDPALWNVMRNGWSFAAHSRANGDPVDYDGIPTGDKDDTDRLIYSTPVNPYITVYRKEEFVWGYSPSAVEQQEKRTHYQMTSQIVAPIHNPAEEYLFMEQVMPSITVNGWAEVTDENGNPNGEINDIWVNGVRVRDVSSVVQYNSAADRWNLSIPVPVRNGGNNVDITIFGGPDPNCSSCHGCAFTNHSFYVEFRGAEPYPSTMRLLDCANQNVDVRDSARVDETCFYIFVDDMNGNLNKDGRDTVWVSVVNPVFGDSLSVRLIETGDSTGHFRSANTVRVVSTPPSQRGPNEISMDGGQTIWVTYIDPTDSEDISQITLASRAEFAVPTAAWFKDADGVGAIDQVYVRYSKIPDRIPDSLHVTIPGQAAARAVRAPNIAPAANDQSVILFTLDPAIENITGWRAGEQMTARSFILYSNVVREAVIPVADSAGPALLAQALLFEKIGTSALDTLQITLSEPLPSSNILGNTLVLRKGSGTDILMTVSAAVDSSLLVNSLTLIVNPQSDRILEGDSVFINPTGAAVDRAGNNAHNRNRPVPIVLRSSAPRFTSAVYRDEDGNGMIDVVEMNLSKPLDLTGLRLSLAWGNGAFVPVEWSNLSINSSETVVRANIEGLLTGDSIITVGAMRAMATHNRFPGDTLRADVLDRAAPVVRWAQFAPGGTEDARDTLNVIFSEPLRVNLARPFKFLYGEGAGAVYEMVLQNQRPDAVLIDHSFIVNSIENPEGYPSQNDSVWISTDVILADTSANFQSVENNRRVRLSIKPAPITIRVIPAPNPYLAGDGGPPARIIVRPEGRVLTDLNLIGTIRIYDRLGNLVLNDSLSVKHGSYDLIYEWDGTNANGRRVGSGTYLITATVEHVQEPWEEKVRPITGRERIYMRRN